MKVIITILQFTLQLKLYEVLFIAGTALIIGWSVPKRYIQKYYETRDGNTRDRLKTEGMKPFQYWWHFLFMNLRIDFPAFIGWCLILIAIIALFVVKILS